MRAGVVGFLIIFSIEVILARRFSQEVDVGPEGGGGPCREFLKEFLQSHCASAEGNYGLCRECMPATCLQYVTHPSETDAFTDCINAHNRCCTFRGFGVRNVVSAAVCYGTGWYDVVGLGQISVVQTAIGGQGDNIYSFTGYDEFEDENSEEYVEGNCRNFIKFFLRNHCGQAEGNYKLCGQCMGLTCLRYMNRGDDPRPFKQCWEGHNRCCTRTAGLGVKSAVSATSCYATGWASEVGEGQVSVVRTALGDQSEDAPYSFTGLGKRDTKDLLKDVSLTIEKILSASGTV